MLQNQAYLDKEKVTLNDILFCLPWRWVSIICVSETE